VRSRAPQRPAGKALTLIPLPPLRDRQIVYGFSHVNDGGRIAAAQVLPALGWTPGTALEVQPWRTGLRLTVNPVGGVRVLDAMRIRLPIGLRRRCGITPGTGLLLAADPVAHELLVLPPAALDALVPLDDKDRGTP